MPRAQKPNETGEAKPRITGEWLKEALREIFLLAPTVDWLDLLLQMLLFHIRGAENGMTAAAYLLKEEYIRVVTREQLEHWRLRPRHPDQESFYFSGAWQGPYSAYAGATPQGTNSRMTQTSETGQTDAFQTHYQHRDSAKGKVHETRAE